MLSALYFVVTARSKATQARVGFQSDLFDEFNCSGESLKFAINLTILVDCLQLFGTSSETTSAVMTFSVRVMSITSMLSG